jgi:hypothetical protein
MCDVLWFKTFTRASSKQPIAQVQLPSKDSGTLKAAVIFHISKKKIKNVKINITVKECKLNCVYEDHLLKNFVYM